MESVSRYALCYITSLGTKTRFCQIKSLQNRTEHHFLNSISCSNIYEYKVQIVQKYGTVGVKYPILIALALPINWIKTLLHRPQRLRQFHKRKILTITKILF